MKASLLLVSLTMALSGTAHALTTDQCPRQQGNPFNLSQANANALVSVACTAISHIGNEKRSMEFEDSATMFHLWKTSGNYQEIRVEGYCGVTLPDLKENKIGKYRINLVMKQDPERPVNSRIIIDGVIGGKSLTLDIDNNQFVREGCIGNEASYSKVRGIGIGLSMDHLGQNLMDMIRSRSTFAPLTALETMSWVSNRHGGGAAFPEFGVQFDMGQMNGRHIGIAATQGGLGNIIDVRSAGILNYHDGTGYFDMIKDQYGLVSGFSRQESMSSSATLPNGNFGIYTNNKFQASNVRGGSQVLGCSSLVYNGELSLPIQTADLNLCRRLMEQSLLGQDLQPEVNMAGTLTPAQEKAKFDRNIFMAKIQKYLDTTQGIAQAYASKPGSFEQGRVAWKESDVQRGFVITQRAVSTNDAKQFVMVVERRVDTSGEEKVVRYQVRYTNIK